MFIKNPLYRIVLRMTLYGLFFGGLAGASVFFAARYYYPVSFHDFPELLEVLEFLWICILIGVVWGGMTGLFSGIGLFLISRSYLKNRYSNRRYFENVLVLTAIIVSFFFLPAFMATIWFEWIGLFLFVVWVLIAFYCSYRTITLFLRESDVRKRKAKPYDG